MPLGDSLTDGYDYPGGYRQFLWRFLAERGKQIKFVGSQRNGDPDLPEPYHEGHSGWRIADIHSYIHRWLTDHPADIILLLIGTNDVLQGYDPTRPPTPLSDLLDRIYQLLPNVIVLLGTLPPIDEPYFQRRVQAFNAYLPSIVQLQADRGRRIQLVDIYTAITSKDLIDGVHPTPAGHQKIAEAWAQVLLPLLP